MAAIEAGADALGFNFWYRSKRALVGERWEMCNLIPAWLPRLAMPGVKRVAVVVDPEPDLLRALVESGCFEAIQFHGEETPADCSICAIPWWKAIALREGTDLSLAKQFSAAAALLLDAPAPPGVYGGTGIVCDWNAAACFIRSNPGRIIWLAGGLTPENVARAVQETKPFGVDVAGGVESSNPRKKDIQKMRAFIQAAKQARST